MSNTSNGDLGQTVLNTLIKIAKKSKSKNVHKAGLYQLAKSLNIGTLELVSTLRQLSKNDCLQVIFDKNALYFSVTKIGYEVMQ